jgi:hypothetical protein
MASEFRTGVRSGHRPRWRVHYVGSQMIVTSLYIEVAGTRVRVPELRDIRRCLTFEYPMLKMTAIMGATGVVLAAPLVAAYGSSVLIVAALASTFGMIFGAGVEYRKNPRVMAIEATARGQKVVLFSTRNRQEFGHVWRALVRAIEENREPPP